MERLTYHLSEQIEIPFIDTGLKDADYIESLNWSKNIQVINYSPYKKYPNVLQSPLTFLSQYEARQKLLLNLITQISQYIRVQNLQTTHNVKKDHLPTLRGFIAKADVFFAETTYFSLEVKDLEVSLYLSLRERYPHLDTHLFLTPSQPASPILKILKASEYVRGINYDFAGIFCAGNRDLATRVVKKLPTDNEVDIRETARSLSIEKGYFMQGRNDIKLLDRILVIDNTIENLIWKDSWMTVPLYHIYNLAQEIVSPTLSFVKEKYVFDIKKLSENL